jgi:hypothetical protein
MGEGIKDLMVCAGVNCGEARWVGGTDRGDGFGGFCLDEQFGLN